MIFFKIVSLFTKLIIAQKRANLIIAVALTILCSIYHLIHQQLLLSLTASIKNNITTLVIHVYLFNNPLKKTLHYAINVISTEAELFAIRCRINQAAQIPSTSHIIIITDTLHAAQRIFDLTIYLYQI